MERTTSTSLSMTRMVIAGGDFLFYNVHQQSCLSFDSSLKLVNMLGPAVFK